MTNVSALPLLDRPSSVPSPGMSPRATDERKSWLEEMLELVPTGGVEQNLFRAYLFHDLSAALVSRDDEGTVADMALRTMDRLRREYPSCTPRFHPRLLWAEWPVDDVTQRAAETERMAVASAGFLKLR